MPDKLFYTPAPPFNIVLTECLFFSIIFNTI